MLKIPLKYSLGFQVFVHLHHINFPEEPILSLILMNNLKHVFESLKKGKRKVQGVPQSQAAALPRHWGRGNRQTQASANRTNVRKALRLALSSPSEVIAMLKGPRVKSRNLFLICLTIQLKFAHNLIMSLPPTSFRVGILIVFPPGVCLSVTKSWSLCNLKTVQAIHETSYKY